MGQTDGQTDRRTDAYHVAQVSRLVLAIRLREVVLATRHPEHRLVHLDTARQYLELIALPDEYSSKNGQSIVPTCRTRAARSGRTCMTFRLEFLSVERPAANWRTRHDDVTRRHDNVSMTCGGGRWSSCQQNVPPEWRTSHDDVSKRHADIAMTSQ